MQRALLGVIILIAALVRFWGLWFGLPHTYARPDETIIIDVALSFLRGNLRPNFYDYPWLYMWLLAGLYLLYYAWGRFVGTFHSLADLVASWRIRWTPFFLIPRALTAVVGAATVWPVYRTARRLWDGTTALVAALFIALAFLHVRDSHYGTTDVTMTFLLILSVSFLIDGHLTKRRRDFVIGGLVGGLAAATKYNALLMIVPLTASYLLNIFEETEHRREAVLDPRLFLYGIPFLLTFAIGAPFLLFDLPGVRHEMQVLNDSLEIGSHGLELSDGWIHHLRFSLLYGLGLPLMIAGVAGALAMIVLEPRAAVLLLSFPIVYYAVAGNVRLLFFRYAIPLVPFLCLTAARFVTVTVRAAVRTVMRRSGKPDAATNRVRNLAVAIAAVAVVAPSAYSVLRFDQIISQADNRVIVARWFDQNVPPGSSVLMSGSFFGYVQFTKEMRYNAWVWDRRRHIFVTDLDKRPALGRPEWILLQGSPLPAETQPIVREFLQKDYAFVRWFGAFSPTGKHVYDQQDAFFAPFAGFRGVERPGPNYTLYKRISAQ
jgi:4-amino-4-deoxy-L-arabinose transferase-like glycosyltransferase